MCQALFWANRLHPNDLNPKGAESHYIHNIASGSAKCNDEHKAGKEAREQSWGGSVGFIQRWQGWQGNLLWGRMFEQLSEWHGAGSCKYLQQGHTRLREGQMQTDPEVECSGHLWRPTRRPSVATQMRERVSGKRWERRKGQGQSSRAL